MTHYAVTKGWLHICRVKFAGSRLVKHRAWRKGHHLTYMGYAAVFMHEKQGVAIAFGFALFLHALLEALFGE